MSQCVPVLTHLRPTDLFTVGFVGNCNCGEVVRQRIDALFLYHAAACDGMRVITGIGYRFERCVLLRIEALRKRLPRVFVTIVATSSQWADFLHAEAAGLRNEFTCAFALADEVVLLDAPAAAWARTCHRMIVPFCGLVVEAYKRRDIALREDLGVLIAAEGSVREVVSISGCFIRRIAAGLPGMYGLSGVVSPENDKEEL